MLRKNLKPLYLAGMIELCLLATPAQAQNASQQLVNQGNYWHDQGRDDLAADTWRKLLSIDPNQPDALLGLGQIEFAQGKAADARKRLQQLQAAHPNAPQTQRLRLVLGGGANAAAAADPHLVNARRAAAAGRYVEAVREYEASFNGKPPPAAVALEYYQSLAGTPQGWEKARDGLRRLKASEPANASVSLALAQVLTYREPTRREGIAQLRELSARPDIGGPARNAWRQALLWLNAGPGDSDLYQAWLSANPNDAEVSAKATQLRERRTADTAQDVEGAALGEGFKALNAGNLATAEQRFAQVLRARPRDADALGGLGSVRLRQQRFSEAQELLRPAAAGNGKWNSAYNSARYWLQLQQAEAARKRGDIAQATALAEAAVKLVPNEPAGHAALGNLQAGSDAQAAEASFRKALSLAPDNAAALQGLVALYSRQGRMQEATDLFNRLPAGQREQAGGEAMLRSNVQRAKARQALEAGDAVTAQTELETAMVERPGDPWIRLDLARLYLQAGRPDQARSVMDGLLAAHADLPEAQYANALYAQEAGDWAGAYASLERIPAPSRTPEMTRLRNIAWVEQQARQARNLQQQGRGGEAQMLLSRTEAALGDQIDDPQLLAALAGAWADSGNSSRALTLAQRLVTTGNPGTEQRLQYAGVLLRAHQDAELSAVLRQLQGVTMTPEQLHRYQSLRSGYVLRQVDALRELGNLEGAYEALAPIMSQQPQDPDTLGALARLYSTAGDQRQALVIYQQILQRQPNDLDALVAAANSAAAQSDLDSAEVYLKRALAQAPDSPDVLAAAGRVYRAAGKNRKAEQYFRAALAAQQRDAGQLDNGLPGARGAAAYASASRPLNPFAGMTGPMRGSAAVLSDAAPAAYSATLPAPAAYPASAPAYAGAVPAPAYVPPAPQAAVAYAPDNSGLPPPVSTANAGLAMLPVPGQGTRAPAPVYTGTAVQSMSAGASTQPLPQRRSGNTVLDELREVQAGNSSQISAGAAYRSRDGESGLGQLNDIEMPVQAEFAVGDGKLGASITPTLIDAGAVPVDYTTASRFGGGPSASVADALATDPTKIDNLVGTPLYQGLLTTGDNAATRNYLYEAAVANGDFQTLYNEADGDTAAERRQNALNALYAQPLSQYLLANNLSAMSIGSIATQVLNDPSLRADLDAAGAAQLLALSQSSAASQTPVQFRNALYSMAATGSASRRLDQDDSGVGVAVSYRNGGFSADIGSTPLGFQQQNIVGGVGWRGEAGENLTYSAQASRRAVNDSVLSFAGTEDARTGMQWGGVTSNGLALSGTIDNGLLGGYANLAAHRITGRNVADNDHRQADLGFYVHALETDNQSLTAGINLTAMQYDKNLSGFTYGQGGYFSPQDYFDLGFPVHWTGRSLSQKVNWRLDASVGVQHFRSDDSPYFPTDPTLQQAAYDAASLAAMLGLTDRYVAPVYTGESKTGVSYNVSGAAEWQVAPQLFLGGRLTFNNARDYNQFNTNLYLRFVLDRLGAALGKAPQVVASPYANEY